MEGGGEGKGRMGEGYLEWSVKRERPFSRFQTLALVQVNGLVNDVQEQSIVPEGDYSV